MVSLRDMPWQVMLPLRLEPMRSNVESDAIASRGRSSAGICVRIVWCERRNEDGQLVRTGLSLESDLLSAFDDAIAKKGYGNRSEAIRDLIRDRLVELDVDKNKVVVGTLTIVYDHHKPNLTEKLVSASTTPAAVLAADPRPSRPSQLPGSGDHEGPQRRSERPGQRHPQPTRRQARPACRDHHRQRSALTTLYWTRLLVSGAMFAVNFQKETVGAGIRCGGARDSVQASTPTSLLTEFSSVLNHR